MSPAADEVAARADEAVAQLREAAGTVDKLLLHIGPELLDLPSTPPEVRRRLLVDVDRIGRLLLLHRRWTRRIGALIVEARRTRRGKPVRVLDVGAGSGALLFSIEDWARRQRIPVELTGLDHDPESIALVRNRVAEEGRRVELVAGNARALDRFADGAIDVVVSTLTLHHLTPGDAAVALAEIDRVAAVNFFVFDLRRTLVSLSAAWALLHLGGFDAPTRHDGLLSVRRGYSVAEMEALLRAAGVAHAVVERIPPAYLVVTRA